MSTAKFKVSYDMLKMVLNLPAEAEVIAVLLDKDDCYGPTFTVVVTHPDLPPHARDEMPVIKPVYERVTSEAVRFKEWGVSPTPTDGHSKSAISANGNNEEAQR